MYKKGDPDSIEFAIPSPTAEEMLFFCGGSIDADGKWSEQVMKVKATEVTKVIITGDPKVGTRLIAGVTPEYATGTYKWFRKQGEEEPTEIPNEDSLAYTPDAGDIGYTISVEFTGTEYFSGKVTSAETAAVVA